MNIVAKRLPASECSYRLLFSSAKGARPVGELVVTGADALRALLVDTLEVPQAAASRTVVELESSGNSWLENLPINDGELKIALRGFQESQKV